MPDVASLPLQSMRNGWLYQPSWSAPLAAVAVVPNGAVASYLTTTESDELLPASSVQLPVRVVPVVSGPLYVTAGLQVSMPDRSSVPLHEIETGARYHPAAFGGRAGAASVFGATRSRRTTNVSAELFPALSVQLPVSFVPLVSGPLYEAGAWQDAMPEVASMPLQVTVTGVLSQPFAFGAGDGVASVAGAVAS